MLKAPLDLFPKTTEVTLLVPEGTSLSGGCVFIEPQTNIKEITMMNNTVEIP